MNPQIKDFLTLSMKLGVLKFGQFELKSGRISPFFFNAGLLCTSEALNLLSELFASRLSAHNPEVVFGAAYKGIPFVSAAAVCLNKTYNQNPEWGFNRKEAKAHGEGGNLVGASLKGKQVWILDDVITAGTAVREVIELIESEGASVAGICIALDRKEKGQGNTSAIQELTAKGYKVEALFSIDELIELVSADPKLHGFVEPMKHYRATYGVSS